MESSETLLALVQPGMAFLIGILMALVARLEQKRHGYFLYFAAAFMLYGMGALIQISLVPRHLVTNITVSGVAYLAAALMFCHGLHQLAERQTPWVSLGVIIALSIALRSYYTFVDLDGVLRGSLLHLSLFAMMALTCWHIRHLHHGLNYERLLFWLVFGLAATFILLSFMLIGRNASDYGYDGSHYWLAIQATFYAFNVLIALVLMLVAAGRAIQAVRQAGYLDPLTRINNRTGFRMRVEARLEACARYGLIALDLDYFKCVNDRYGHAVGDAVLKAVGGLLNAKLRPQDVVARYGGEEFLVFLPEAEVEETNHVGVRLCQAIASLDLSELAPDIDLTASAGVGNFSANVPLEEAYGEVDSLLYEAKAAGRNQTWNRTGPIMIAS